MKKILVLGLTIIFLTGCLPQQIEPTADVSDIIATLVAATLTIEPESKDQPGQTVIASVSTVTPDPSIPTEEGPTATLTLTHTSTATATATLTPTITLTPTLAPEDPILSPI